jgi:ABC-type dipeptide/oligopeptide/nickel transport system permease component
VLAYVVRRILANVVVFWVITLIVFLLIHLAPGDPVRMLIPPEQMNSSTAEFVARMRHELGLDQPLLVQYWHWLTGLFTGDLGTSFADGRPVLAVLGERIGPTVLLMGLALLLSLTLAIPLGVVAAARRHSPVDYGSTAVSLAAICTPPFFLGMVAIYIFAVQLRVLPSAGMSDPIAPGLVDSVRHLVMPVAILGFAGSGALTRYVRSSVASELRSDYVRTAQSKGASATRVVFRHVLRNALIPVITVVALSLPGLLAGAVVVEQIFAWPGMGQLAVASVGRHDYPVILGFALLVAILVLVSNLIADILYTVADPRVTLR